MKMTREQAEKYIEELANDYELIGEDVLRLLEQLELEDVLELKTMNKKEKLIWDISEILLSFANEKEEMDNSDFQGRSVAVAKDIIKLINNN